MKNSIIKINVDKKAKRTVITAAKLIREEIGNLNFY